jgi:phosphate transport system permease protein
VGGASGDVALSHATTARRLVRDAVAEATVRALAFAPDGDGLAILSDDGLLRVGVSNPHPEASVRSLTVPLRYEGYSEPRWIWQTTGGESFEPKYSLWPLLFGTLKATFYAMLVSVPLALSAAIYVSQLAPRWLQEVIKPTLELMAGVPTVVVGFVAAIWLAPRFERYLLPSLIAVAALPLIALVAATGWRLLPRAFRRRLPRGIELAVVAFVSVIAFAIAAWIADPVEAHFFGGDLQQWLFIDHGVRTEQRNGLVVGVALGFAVIPVIFTLAEDACSSVPRPLTRAARALGATRWHTAVRLVIPVARPGLAAAVMLGLARAVGETMIVLMVAGNTPLLSLSPLDGMRTMSAAIAFEIPEAVVGSTHYRVLFLTGAALLLFTVLVHSVSRVFVRELWRRSRVV